MGGRKRLSWEETAIRLAFNIAEYRSEDPFTQVGAVIIKQDNSIVLGYNGAPAGQDINWEDRIEKNELAFHAEANVLNNVLPGEVKLLATTHLPCKDCIKVIKQKQIDRVFYSIILDRYHPEVVFELAKKYKIELIKLALE